ncbi:MAG: GatB/YqeY domain-containing protein [Candidatus Omnitrophica bacterium]|nr:GatB/YqeY domain-containing protein [Candidatus Omnitrophota bacterium]
MLQTRISADLITAQKARNTATVSTLRLLKAGLESAAFAQHKSELTDEQTLAVIRKQVKQRQEAIAAYRQGHRDDLAAKEEAELRLLSGYLPQEMPRAEVVAAVKRAIQAVGASSPADVGKVMKQVMPELRGKADGKLVTEVVADVLSGRA